MPEEPAHFPPARGWLVREPLVAVVGLAFGAVGLPLLVYLIGTLLLGPYTGGAPGFYGDYFQDLLDGSPRAWSLLTGPYVFVTLLRLTFMRRTVQARRAAAPQQTTQQTKVPPPEQERTLFRAPTPKAAQQRQAPKGSKRIEPRISLD